MNTLKSMIDSLDVSKRNKRRKAVALVIEALEKIRLSEEGYMERIPLNLHGGKAYADADYSVECIIHAIVGLSDAY